MVNNRYEVYKVKRELKRCGVEYKITRDKVNNFGEPSGDGELIGLVLGLYHETNDHIAVTMGDTTQVRTKKTPSILCIYDDITPLNITIGDKVEVNGKTMKVTGVVNIQEWNLIADISLEVIDNGISH